jgi:hypothetical protein
MRYVGSSNRVTLNDGWKNIWKEAVVACFNVLSQNFHVETGIKH